MMEFFTPPIRNTSARLKLAAEIIDRETGLPDLLGAAKAVSSKSDGLAYVSEMMEELIALDNAIARTEKRIA